MTNWQLVGADSKQDAMSMTSWWMKKTSPIYIMGLLDEWQVSWVLMNGRCAGTEAWRKLMKGNDKNGLNKLNWYQMQKQTQTRLKKKQKNIWFEVNLPLC